MKKLTMTVLAAVLALSLGERGFANPTTNQPKGNIYASQVLPTIVTTGGTQLSGSVNVQMILFTVSNTATSGAMEWPSVLLKMAPQETATATVGISLTSSITAKIINGGTINLSTTIPANSVADFQPLSRHEGMELGPLTLTAPGMVQNIYGILPTGSPATLNVTAKFTQYDPTKR